MPEVGGARKPSVLIADPFFGDLGGAKIVTLWMIEALKADFEVTVFCWRPFDLQELNGFVGTRLDAHDFRFLRPPLWVRWLGEFLTWLDKDPYSILRWTLMMRLLKRIACRFDVLVSCNDETDFGRAGIQYIHYPYLHRHARLVRLGRDWQAAVRSSQRWRPWRLLCDFQFANLGRNKTLTNSGWTAELLKQSYALEAEVLYPPVEGAFGTLPWEERDEMVVCVGRLASDKRLGTIVNIVRLLRQKHPRLGLRLVGTYPTDPDGPREFQNLRGLAAENDWIEIHLDVSREQLAELIGRSKIGMHAKVDEHFGIGVAEMVRGGCAVLAHNSGGPREILGFDARLLYLTEAEAAEKVSAILSDSQHRSEVFANLREQARLFSARRFVERFREVVAEFQA
jgi:glycosyltransferase involved in cell wall biosynthesis